MRTSLVLAWLFLGVLSACDQSVNAGNSCNAMTCATGCCDGQKCVTGTESLACGTAGQQCVNCEARQSTCSVGRICSVASSGGGTATGGGVGTVGGGASTGGGQSLGGGAAGGSSTGGGTGIGGGAGSVGGGSPSGGGATACQSPANRSLEDGHTWLVNTDLLWLPSIAASAPFFGAGPSIFRLDVNGPSVTWSQPPGQQPPAPGSVTNLWTCEGSNEAWASAGIDWVLHGISSGMTTHWSTTLPTPTPSSPNPLVQGFWGARNDDVWAVGNEGNTGTSILHWNGTAWTPAAALGDLYGGVWGSSASDVWAVGESIVHWNGSAWSTVVAKPDAGTLALTSVAGSGPNDIWAVGNNIMHWNGTAWSTTPNLLSLRHVAVISPSEVWAITWDSIYRWNGATWVLQPGPTLSNTFTLTSIGGSGPWISGYLNIGGPGQGFVLRP